MRAIALEKTGRYFAAEQAYRRALELEPDTRETAFRLARLLSVLPDPALRDGAEAVALCERACAARPCESAEELDVCAMAYMEAGRQAEAIEKADPRCGRSRAPAATLALARKIAGRLAAYQRGQPTRLRTTPSGVAPER